MSDAGITMLYLVIIVGIIDVLVARAIIRDMLAHYRIETATKRRLTDA